MLYQRQKELLYLIAILGKAGKTQLQKLTYLANLNRKVHSYDFLPYKYGPFSFILQNDLDYLVKNNYIKFINDKYIALIDDNYTLPTLSKENIDLVFKLYSKMTNIELMQFVYREHPFYAINSNKAKDILTKKELKQVEKLKPSSNDSCLFTIGYEHKNIDKYLCMLIENNIKVLIDVRAVNLSMKKEFSGRNLSNFCKQIKIEYMHIPELGISTELRRKITDKKELFNIYTEEILPLHTSAVKIIEQLLSKYQRVALTCFEANKNECHRSILADKVISNLKNKCLLEHL